jgi:lipopolysaccharide export system permease protein
MKIVDRYVVMSFLRNYALSFLVLVGMYIALDMIFNFDELVEAVERVQEGSSGALWTFFAYTADYYFYQIFLYYVHLSGIIPVVATAFTLMRLSRFNEMIALLGSGVPLLRIAAPIVLTGIVLQGILWVDQEMVIPRLVPKLQRKHDYGADSRSFSVTFMRDEQNRKLSAARYYPADATPRMEIVDIISQDAEYRPTEHLRAKSAVWDAGRNGWRLIEGVLTHYRVSAEGGVETVSAPRDFYQSSITPTELELYRHGDFVELLSTRQINELLRRPQSYGREDLLRVKYGRIAQILINVVMLLLAVSCVMSREPGQLKTAAVRCVFLCGSCLTGAFLGQKMAGGGLFGIQADAWPALMAWLPVFVFGPYAVFRLDRVKT